MVFVSCSSMVAILRSREVSFVVSVCMVCCSACTSCWSVSMRCCNAVRFCGMGEMGVSTGVGDGANGFGCDVGVGAGVGAGWGGGVGWGNGVGVGSSIGVGCGAGVGVGVGCCTVTRRSRLPQRTVKLVVTDWRVKRPPEGMHCVPKTVDWRQMRSGAVLKNVMESPGVVRRFVGEQLTSKRPAPRLVRMICTLRTTCPVISVMAAPVGVVVFQTSAVVVRRRKTIANVAFVVMCT